MNQKTSDLYREFAQRLRILIGKRRDLITTTLSNIFTMRLLGNKTHGDLAEVALAEFVNQYMYDFRSEHVGKELFRAKSREEDIVVICEVTKEKFPISIKAYGKGPLQLSTDKNYGMFPLLESKGDEILDAGEIRGIFSDPAFSQYETVNVLPLIYDERNKKCNIMLFDYHRACGAVVRIARVDSGRGRIHPVYQFYDQEGGYVCEVRYGGAGANALQRGLWTNTERSARYFHSLTGGWIDYSDNLVLIDLFSRALVASQDGHARALPNIDADIDRLRKGAKS